MLSPGEDYRIWSLKGQVREIAYTYDVDCVESPLVM
jgi:hypothetical protein